MIDLVDSHYDMRRARSRSELVPHGGGYVLATSWGVGPPILLLHGWRADHTTWARLVPHLAPSFRCVALDFRGGAGRSSALPGDGEGTWDTTVEDVAVAARWAGAVRPLLVGASWGGKIALAYAARGHVCAGVVCVDGMAYGEAGTLHEDTYARVACPVTIVLAERGVFANEDVAAFSHRHPDLDITWLPCGHDVANELPGDLARVVAASAAAARPV